MSEELSRTQWGFAIRGEGTDAVEIDVYDVIGDSWWGGVSGRSIRQKLRAAQDAKRISVKIHSNGGDVIEGLAIYNQLKNSAAHVTVQIDGIAASMASVIAMAADEILMPESAWMMIHNPWGFGIGESEDLREHADLLDKHKAALVAIYAERTGIASEEVAKLMDAETWMNGKEAVDLGFADKLTTKPKKQSKGAMRALASARRFGFSKLPQAIADIRPESPAEPPQPALVGPEADPDDGKEASNMADNNKKDDKVEATPSIARALGLPAGSPESEILAAAARCRELEIQVMTLTESKSSSEALGAVRELVKTAGDKKDLEARLAKVEGERDEQNFDSEINRGLAERKLTPAEAKHERECFEKSKAEGRGAERVEELRGRLKVASPRIAAAVRPAPIAGGASSGAAPVLEHNGKKYDDMTFAQRAKLSKEDPGLYRAMKSDYDERRKSA